MFYGQITNPATWTAARRVAQSINGNTRVACQLRIASAMIDTGYQSKIVYDFCKPRENCDACLPVKGVGGVAARLSVGPTVATRPTLRCSPLERTRPRSYCTAA